MEHGIQFYVSEQGKISFYLSIWPLYDHHTGLFTGMVIIYLGKRFIWLQRGSFRLVPVCFQSQYHSAFFINHDRYRGKLHDIPIDLLFLEIPDKS